MKLKLLIVFVLCYTQIIKLNCNNNVNSGEVEYGFVQNNISEEDKEKSKEFYGFLDKMNQMSSDLSFILKFNLKESYFNLEEQMESDTKPSGMSFANNIVSKGAYYFDKSNDILLREANNFDKYTLVKSKPSQKIWTMTKETKKIDKYLCYKATQIKTVKNNSGIHEFEIVAWYCPDIPVPFGPKEFNNLPGLILELKDSHYTFFAKKISISHNDKLVIKKLKSKNIITETEYEEFTEKINKSIKEKTKN